MRLDIYHHFELTSDHEVRVWLQRILTKLDHMEDTILPSLADLQAKADEALAAITADTDLDNAVAAVVTNQNATIADLRAQLAAAGTDPAQLQAVLDTMDHVLALRTSNAAIVSAAVTAGTTPVPTP